MILPATFFNRPAPEVAKDLLGKTLVRNLQGKKISLQINEVEAYGGLEDKASHARFGRTPRTAPMFGPPGYVYMYFTYGIHWMLNIVCEKEGVASAVLIRGAGDIVGPARLTKALQLDKSFNSKKLGKQLELWVEDRGVKVQSKDIFKTPRVGIAYAGDWVEKPWRFILTQK